MRKLAVPFLLVLAIASLHPTGAQGQAGAQNQANWPNSAKALSELDKVYADESHCLAGPEIRSERDNPISCYCRDAIVDARYVHHTYVLPGKDDNLRGIVLALEVYSRQMCGENYEAWEAINSENWKWNGPEVVRTSPPDDVLRQIKPDSHGMIHYEYTVVILQRDSSRHVVKTESFTARDIVPVAFLKDSSKPSPRKTPPQH